MRNEKLDLNFGNISLEGELLDKSSLHDRTGT